MARAVVLAGGKGTRLRPYTTVLPKPLMPVGDRPILDIVVRQLKNSGFERITMATGYLAELIGKVREGQVTPPEVSGGTFTVSNLGMYGIDSFSAIINPPQAALLTVGALKKRAVPDERGRISARDMMNLTLICDHRILYGADGAEFLARVRELLESPLSLAL